MMAKAPAQVLKSLGFQVSAWVRNPRKDADVPIFHGPNQLEPFLQQTAPEGAATANDRIMYFMLSN
jgi:glyoxylate/hydroxypyruvate reductase A